MSNALAQLLGRALSSLGHAVETTSGERLQPADLLTLAGRTERALAERGIAPNEPVHVRIGNKSSDLASLLGVWRAGAVAVPVHGSAALSTLERVQRASGARFSIDGDGLDVLSHLMPPDRALLRDAALVIFTSGSTGTPKGVVIGHQRFADKLAVLDRLIEIRPDDVVLSPLQLTFIFGLWVSLLALMKGARLLLVPKFTNEAIAHHLARSTILAGVPSMFRTLLTDPGFSASNLRLVLTGGEVFTPGLAHNLRRITPAAILDLYGLTETGSCDFSINSAGQSDGFGTIGKPTERVLFRLARDGRGVAIGEVGELQINTPFGMLGYLDNPELTDASFDGDYFGTGDLARMTAAGRVELIGRIKDIISRGGHKIAPLEIDNLLAQHPDVAAALCAGVPDDRLGEVIHAVVVPRHGTHLDAVALRDWLLARAERFKVPDVFYFRDVLPSGSSGKADRRAVAQLAAERTSS